MEFERVPIPLARLRLNKENDRHGPLPSELEAIEWLLENHRDHMINLAKDVAAYGLSPIESILVLPGGEDASGDFVVWEGNRRVATLKILEDTNRCHDAQLRRRFSEIKGQAKVHVPQKIECVIAPSAEEADRLIELRHQGMQDGIGTVSWDAKQKHRHQERRGKRGRYAVSLQVLNFVEDKLKPELKEKVEGRDFPISTLDRILKNTHARNFLGIELDNGVARRTVDEKEMLKGVTKILEDLSEGMSVRRVYNNKLIHEYLDGFGTKHRPDIKKTVKKPVAIGKSLIPAKPQRSRPADDKRKKLLQSVTYSITLKRLNAIYRDLKSIDVFEHTNAVAVLFRVFLELSVDQYLSEHKVVPRNEDKLSRKIQLALEHMKSQGWIDKQSSKGINTAIASSHNPHSIDTFHAYVHNRQYQPEPRPLNTAFDNLEPFFGVLFEHLK